VTNVFPSFPQWKMAEKEKNLGLEAQKLKGK